MGKTASLYHTVHYARRAGWVVLLVPSAYEYLHEGGLVRPSPFFKGFFDTVRGASVEGSERQTGAGRGWDTLPYTEPPHNPNHGSLTWPRRRCGSWGRRTATSSASCPSSTHTPSRGASPLLAGLLGGLLA